MSILNELAQWAEKALPHLPFFMGLANGTPRVKLSMQRVLEAIIIGAIISGLGYVVMIPRLEERITLEFLHVKQDMARIERSVEDIRQRVDQDYRDLVNRQARELRNK